MFRSRLALSLSSLPLLFAACSEPQTVTVSENPFFEASTLPYQAPPFDRITDADYQPAIEEGMERQLPEVESIATPGGARPPSTTRSSRWSAPAPCSTRVQRVFNAVTSANTDDTLQAVQAEEAPKLAAHGDAIYLNPTLFARVKAIYDGREDAGLDADAAVPGGALLPGLRARRRRSSRTPGQATLRALNEEESKLGHAVPDRAAGGAQGRRAVIVADSAELAGLSARGRSAAADEAKSRGAGRAVGARPAEHHASSPPWRRWRTAALRERVMEASLDARLRRGARHPARSSSAWPSSAPQKAKLLGYPTWADYVLDDQMAKTPGAATSC